MATVLLVIHIMVAAALVGLVLLQRSEGGALGIGGSGGGGSGGGFMSGRGAANLLTRVTALFAATFFVTSILLTLIASEGSGPGTSLDNFTIQGNQGDTGSQTDNPLDSLKLPPQQPAGPQVPQSQ